jgi:hypothetical protein
MIEHWDAPWSRQFNSRYETSLLKRLADERKAKAIEAQRAETVKHGSGGRRERGPAGVCPEGRAQ